VEAIFNRPMAAVQAEQAGRVALLNGKS
jgi:hypothetical protein